MDSSDKDLKIMLG